MDSSLGVPTDLKDHLAAPHTSPLPSFQTGSDYKWRFDFKAFDKAHLQPTSLVHLTVVCGYQTWPSMTCKPITDLNQFFSCFPSSHSFP